MAVELEPLVVGLGDERAGLHAQQGVVGLGVLGPRVVAVVGGEQRRADALGDLDELRVGAGLLGDAVVLQLDEEVVAPEDLLEPAGLRQRLVEPVGQQALEHVAAEAAGGGDDPPAVLGEQVPVDLGLAVVALEEGPRRELDEVLVALVVLRQDGEVVVGLLAAVALAAGVVDLAADVDALDAVVVGLVELAADDRGDAVGAARLVEGQDPVHVAVVGDARPPAGRRLRPPRRGPRPGTAPSSIEYSVCTWQCTNDPANDSLSPRSTCRPQRPSTPCGELQRCDFWRVAARHPPHQGPKVRVRTREAALRIRDGSSRERRPACRIGSRAAGTLLAGRLRR